MKTKFWVKAKPKKSIFKHVWTYVILGAVVGLVVMLRRGPYGG
jgi:hypothetical protein